MNNTVTLTGMGYWSDVPGAVATDWPSARAQWSGGHWADHFPRTPSPPCRPQGPLTRPSPQLLPPAERRRAPDSVALALHVAHEAVTASGYEASTLPSVFACTHGDLPITDHLCHTLARTPSLLSPTKFHHSVHNAAAGYWTIATGCQAASTAVCAQGYTLGMGLLETLSLVLCTQAPALLVAYDVPPSGPLRDFIDSPGLGALALVLAPTQDIDGVATNGTALQVCLRATEAMAPPACPHVLAAAWPLMHAVATHSPKRPIAVELPLNPHLVLAVSGL